MELRDLFATHKQVDPISFNQNFPISQKPLYFNFDRAQRVASENTEDVSENTSETTSNTTLNWRVKGSSELEDEEDFESDQNWRTRSTQPKPSQTKSEKEEKIINNWINPYKDQKDLWIKDITNAYKKAGLNDNAIKNLIAKNALESGWGKAAQGAYNFGNITTGNYWSGNYVQGNDKDANGNSIKQKFRSYNTLDDFVKDEINFLTKLYDFNQDDNFDIFINKLQGKNSGERRYAEDKDYVSKVKSVYNSI